MSPLILAAIALAPQDNVRNAPEFVGSQWLNTDKPLTLAARHGKVTMVHFWTFACINCKHNLPAVQRLYDRFKSKDVELISIHTPELPEEKDLDNVKKAVEKYGIKYPVLIDDKYSNWKAWRTEYWPSLYLVDKWGRIRWLWSGELNYNGMTGEQQAAATIERMLRE